MMLGNESYKRKNSKDGTGQVMKVIVQFCFAAVILGWARLSSGNKDYSRGEQKVSTF